MRCSASRARRGSAGCDVAPVVVGGRSFRIRRARRGEGWTAFAARVESGDRYGPNFAAPSEDEAAGAVERWLVWQHEHQTVLEALQAAERAYHRSMAEQAFGSLAGGTADRALREALGDVERLRIQLDEVRARRPRGDGGAASPE